MCSVPVLCAHGGSQERVLARVVDTLTPPFPPPHQFFNIAQGVPQGCTLSPTFFQVFINDLLKVIEAVGKGVKVGEAWLSGMLFEDDFVGMSDTLEGHQLLTAAAKDNTDEWRLYANVQKGAVQVCNKDGEKPVEYRWKWGVEELAVVDQCTYL
ncbi:unnamed protein product, partial [Ectocarpus sp. 12 AP-2014]